MSHVGAHEAPLSRLDEHVPKAPFVGAVIVQEFGLHTAVLVVSVPALHVCTLCASSCWNSEGHAGGQRGAAEKRRRGWWEGGGMGPGGWRKDEECQVGGEGE